MYAYASHVCTRVVRVIMTPCHCTCLWTALYPARCTRNTVNMDCDTIFGMTLFSQVTLWFGTVQYYCTVVLAYCGYCWVTEGLYGLLS